MENKKVMAKGYSEAGASLTRRALKGFIPNSGSPAEDINANNYTLRQRARMLYMSAPIATSAINTSRTKVVGSGLTLKSSINTELLGISADEAKEWQRKTEAEFKLWAEKKQNCDAIGLNNFYELQQLVLKSWLMSGDVFVLIKRYEPTHLNPYTLRLHVIEADRISTPTEFKKSIISNGMTEGEVSSGKPGAGNKIYDGVEVDKNGMVAAYYISNIYPNQLTSEKQEWTRIPAYGEKTALPNILHIFNPERPEQYRGVSFLAPIIEPLLQTRRYVESELMAALVQSFFTAWIETSTDTSEIPFNEVGSGIDGVPEGNPANISDEVSKSENEYEMSPGSVIHLADGEKVVFGNPALPSAGFEPFMKTMSRLMGAALELPYDILVKEFNSSYSASRGALLEAWDAFKMRRQFLIDDFVKPVYEIWLAEAAAIGRIKAPGFFDNPLIREAWCSARWIGPVQGQLDSKKEAESAIMLAQNGIKTYSQITRELGGGDWQENVLQLKKEKEALADAVGNTDIVIEDSADDEEEET